MQLFIAPMHTEEQREWASDNELSSSAGASLMAFMMRDVNYSAEFLTGAANKLDEFEQLVRRTAPWAMPARGTTTPAYSPFNESEDAEHADPMAEMMRALSRQPEVGIRVHRPSEGRRRTSTSTSATGATTGTTASRPSRTA